MSTAEIIAQLPKLSSAERRRLADAIFELEGEAQFLHDCDKRADEHFAILDVMEAEAGEAIFKGAL